MITACALAGVAGSAFAQDAATLTCAEYAALDNEGKMAMVAELQSINAESASSQELTNADIENTLASECGPDGAALLIDLIKSE
jgi:hypothetical protein